MDMYPVIRRVVAMGVSSPHFSVSITLTLSIIGNPPCHTTSVNTGSSYPRCRMVVVQATGRPGSAAGGSIASLCVCGQAGLEGKGGTGQALRMDLYYLSLVTLFLQYSNIAVV